MKNTNLKSKIISFLIIALMLSLVFSGAVMVMASVNTTINDTSADDEAPIDTDTKSPIISDVSTVNITANSTTITWRTDEPSDSLVKYGIETGNYTLFANDPSFVTGHSIKITGLLPSTIYYYVVNRTDSSGTQNESAEYDFNTLPESEGIVDVSPPTLTFVPPTPANNSIVNESELIINITANEYLDIAILDWNGTNETMQGSGRNWYTNKILTNWTYLYRVYGNDSADNWAVSGTRTVTIAVVPPTKTAPLINNWFNSITKDNSTSITINKSQSVFFNATADQDIDSWHWYKDGIDQSNNCSSYTTSFNASGSYSVAVNATNANGVSNTAIFNITVTDVTISKIPTISGAPLSGDWVISGTESYSDQEIILNGNLSILGGASLTLNNVTLIMNGTANGQRIITIQQWGSLYTDISNITGNYYYYFRNYGYLNMQDSSVSTAYSLEFYDSSDDSSVINNSTIKNNANSGISVYYASPTINHNTISDSGSYGIYAAGSSPIIINNTISGSSNYGIYAYRSSSARIENNMIKNNNNGGIYIQYSSPTLINNVIDKNGQYGVYVTSSSYPKIISCTISDQKYGIRSDSQTVTVENSRISSTSYDYYLRYGAYIKSTNTSFSKSKVLFSGTGGALDVYWHDTVTVEYDHQPVNDSFVEVFDNANSLVTSGVTDDKGQVKLAIKEYTQGHAAMLNYTPHILKATKTGYPNGSIESNVTWTKSDTIVLGEEVYIPEQPIVIFGDWIINDSVSYSNKTIIVDNGNIIIEDGGSLTLNSSLLELRYTTNAGYKIEIQNGANLFLSGSSVTASYPELNFYYYFRNYGYLNMQNSSVSTAYSIEFYDSSDDSSVINNSTIKNNANYGIYVYYASPTIIDNTISDSGSYGIYADRSSPNIINNAISGSSNYGIYVYQSSSPRIENNTIKNNNNGGIYIYRYSSPTIINNVIDKNGQYGVYVYSSSSYPKIIGCTISDQKYGIRSDSQTVTVENTSISSASYDYYLYYSAYIKSTNTSFSKSKVLFSGTGGALDVYWHDTVTVEYDHQPVNDSFVEVFDNANSLVTSGVTDDKGQVKLAIKEYTQGHAAMLNYTPHILKATKTGYPNGSIESNVTWTKSDTIVLGEEVYIPEQPIVIFGDWIINDSVSYSNKTIIVDNGNIIIEDGGSLTLNSSLLELRYTTNAGYKIEIQNGANLFLSGSSVTASYPELNFYYYFRNYGYLNMQNSSVSTAYSIEFYDSSDDSSVINNSTIKNNANYGIYVYYASPTIIDNTISDSGSYGIYADRSSPNIINNAISGSSNYGIYVYQSSSPRIENNTIKNNNNGGIYIYRYSSPTIINNVIDKNGQYGVYVYSSSSYPKIIGCTISDQKYGIRSDSQTVTVENTSISSASYDYYLYYSAYIKSTNTSFSKSKVLFSGTGGALDVYWHDTVTVEYDHQPVNDSFVEVFDNANSLVTSGVTDDKGQVKLAIKEYTQGHAAMLNYTPHILKATKTGYPNGSIESNVTWTKSDTIVLGEEVYIPEQPIVIFGDWIINDSVSYSNKTIIVDNGNIIIEDGGSLTLNSSLLELRYTTNAGYKIEIQNGANLFLSGSSVTASYPELNFYYYFRNYGYLNMQNSSVSTAYSIEFYDSSDDSSVINNSTIKNNANYGIYVYYASPTIIDNTISDSGSYGIYADRSSPNIINNAISGSSNYGIYVYQSSSPRIENNTIKNNNNGGIYIYRYSSPTIINNVIDKNGQYGVYVYSSSSYPKIIGCTISDQKYGIRSDSQTVTVENTSISSASYDYYLYYSAYIKSTNTSFSKSKVLFSGTGGALDVYWHDTVTVEYDHQPVNDSFVEVFDNANSLVTSGVTDDKGQVKLAIKEYTQGHAAMLNYTPHILKATKTGYPNGSIESNVTWTKSDTIVLGEEVYIPEQPIVIFGDWIINDSVSYSNKTIIVDNGNIIIEDGGSLTLNSSLLELRYTTNAGYKIEIQNGANLFLSGSSVTASYPELNFYYYFRNYGYLNMQNSSVSTAYSIEFYDSSDDSSVINNSTIKNNANYGIYVYYASPTIIDNTISDSGSYGIYADRSSPNIINNAISGSSNYGIYVYQSSSPRIENNTIKNNNNGGIYIYRYSSPTIINNVIDKNGQYGVYVYSSSSYPKIIGCTISDQKYGIRSDSQTVTVENTSISSASYDYYLYYSAYIKSTNTSFSKSKVLFSGTGGALDVYWHLDVKVVDANTNPISKANVSVRDYFDTVIYNGTTDLEGWTREIVSEAYKQTAAGETYYTPHNVSAEYNDTANSTIVTIAKSKEATVMLSINQPLTALILSPDNNSLFIQGDTIDFTGIGFDPIDGILANSSLTWTSSIDGEIGIGSYLSLTNLSVGNHTVTFTATNSLNENVTDTVEITVIGRADLIVVDVEWSHMSPNLDDNVTFNATVKNIGMGYAIQPFYVRFYINYTYLGQTIVNNLSANESIIVTQTWTAAPDAEDITVVADYYDDIQEINESNNTRTELLPPVRLPDIVVSAITWTPTTFNESQMVNFSALIENMGAGNTTRYFEVKFYIDNTSIGSEGVNGIMAGNITSVSRTWTATPGDHTIKVVADDLNQVPEYNETNNDRIESLAMIEYADLTVSSITWTPATFCDGDTVNFTAIVENIGAGNITKYFDVNFYIENSSIGSVGVNGLMSGKNVSVWKTWTAVPGNHTIKVAADDPNRVTESDETNNERIESLPGVEQADLIVENITWTPSNLSDGQVVTFTASIGNIGLGNTTRVFYTRFLIDNASIGEKSVSGLDSGSSATSNQTWTATAGEHRIKAVVDAYNHVEELNETNNWLSKNISQVQVEYLLFISSSSESYAEGDNATFSARASRQSSPTAYLGDNEVNLSLTILDESDIIVFTSPMSYANKVFSGNVNLTGYSKGNYTARVTLKDNNNVTVEKSIPFMVVENFSVSISTNKLSYDRDEIVHITGNAQYTDGSQVISAPVVLKIKLKGYTRTYSLITGSDGNFSYYYNPNYMEAGNFTAEANVVSDKLWRSAQTSYTMYGLYMNPSGIIDYWMSKNTSENLTFILRNYGESYLNSVTVNVVDEDMGDGVDAMLLQPPTPTLMPGAEQLFTLKLTAGNVDVLPANFSVSVTSAEGSSEEAKLFVHLVEAVPIAIVNPTVIEAGMNPDDLLVRTVNITNNGYESMNNITISIPTWDWMSVTSADLGSISPGMGKFFDIIIHPTNDTAPGVYQETITISSSNHQPVSIYLSISVTSSQQGDLMFRVVNDVGENITGASIVIQNQNVLTQVLQGTTNETGHYLFDDISTSRYNFIVQASGHASTSNSITVAPDVQTRVEPVLPKSILGVQLTVTPIQIGDDYDIELDLTFETEVPPPILIPNPLYISYGVNFIDPEYETDGDITISNPGLISVFNVTVDSSFLAGVDITFPTGKTFFIGELKAKSSVTIPYHLTVTSVSCESKRHRDDIRIKGDYIYFEEYSDVTHNVYLSSEIPVFINMYNCPVEPGNPIDDIIAHFTFHYVLPGGSYSPPDTTPPQPIPQVVDTVHERVKFSISQEATLERDAFAACLELTNKLTDKNIEGVKVVLNIKDEDSSDAADMFFVNQTFLNNINSIAGSGVITPSAVATADWLLVPKPGTGGTDSAGKDYTVQAFINYTVDCVPFSVNITEEKINVMPQPLLNLTYTIPGAVKADTPFNITLNVTNVGYGIARNLKLDSAQPVIYDNKAGLLVSFELIGSGIEGGSASDSMLINFGDIAPGESKTAYWIMTASLDGEFTEFKASFSHNSAIGGDETSLIKSIAYIYVSDTTPPIVSSVSPEDNATGVKIDTTVTATFNEAMDSATITTNSFTLAGSAVSGTVTYDSDTYIATFTPDANLEYNHKYTATLSTDITDEAGNPLAEPYTWSFTTQSTSLNQPPDSPTLISQHKTDGTEISVGGTTDERTVTFKGMLSDPDSDQVKLQIELRRLGEYGGEFDETKGGFKESVYIESGSEAIASAYGLINEDYHWRARAVDQHGNIGEWVDFGNNDISDADFIVTSQTQPPVAFFTYSPQKPKAGEEVILDASNSYDPDGKITLYEWDLGGDGEYDGFTTSPEIFYYWDESGTYSVKLRVTDNDGATDTFVKEINVDQNSWWEKIKKFFAPSVEALSESEKRRFEIIKSELHISNYPHSDDLLSDLEFYRISDDQLLTVLKKKIEPQAGDLTYETLIIDTLRDMKLADSVAGRDWTVNPEVVKYFENMADINVWAKEAEFISKELLEGSIKAAGGSGIGVGAILMLPDLCQAGIGVKLLDETYYRRALWFYFFNREGGDSPEETFGFLLPPKYINEATREYFESLWIEYGGPHISDRGGLKYDFQEQVINQLRTLLLSGIEKYKFEPYQIYSIKSPGEVHVYDSQDRVTGLVNGEVNEEIPNSAYDDESKTVLIFNSTDSYYCKVAGTDEGTYGLEVASVEDGEATTFTATDIPTTVGATHQYTIDWDALAQGEEGVTIQIDSDGDGVFEQSIASDGELTQDEYLSATDTTPPVISNVTAATITTNSAIITWDTDELSDSLVKYGTESGNYTVQKYNSTNVTLHTVNITELLSNTTYYYLVNSTDAGGNANEGVEYNFTTAVISDTTPPETVSNLGEIDRGSSWILWNWTNPSEPDFNHTEVWIDDEFKVTVITPEHTYNATGLSASTTYEIGTRTVDGSGNVNWTWVNDTATTLIHDVNVSTDYAAATNGIKIKYNKTEIPANVNLTIGDAYDIYYKIVNEGDYNETVNVSVLVANSTWRQTVDTHTWNIKIGSYRYSGGDSWDTSALIPGEYNITVNASIPIDDNWLNNERIRAVTFAVPSNLPPVADPSGPYSGTEGEVIQFNGSGSYDPDGSIYNYIWDFGDGNTGKGEKPTHTYAQNGTYNVTLNVTDNEGATDTNTTTAMIADTEPTANFSGTPTIGLEPLTVNFTDNSTSYDGITWTWDFGDGNTSTKQNPSHTYSAGTYTVNLTVTEGDGDCNTETKVDYINVTRENQPPVADPNGPYEDTEGEVIEFNGSGSFDSDGSIANYTWDFGDGFSGYGEKPTHKYAQNGTYTVSLNVTDNDGATDTNSTTATIADTVPTANFFATPTSGLESLTVDFTDTSTAYDTIVSWTWDFGDGNTSTEQYPNNIYAAGIYTVNLTVTDADGDSDTETKVEYINVTRENQPPVADPNGPYEDTEGEVIAFNGSGSFDSDGSIANYTWDFGDGNTGTGEKPTHTYAQNGTYNVTLNVTDDDGATDVNTTTATIADTEPTANFSAMPTSGLEPLTVNFTDNSTSYDGVTAWDWDFGDGDNSSEQDPTHEYTTDGTYTVSLTVHEADGDSDTETKEDYISVTSVNQPPVSDPNGPYAGTEGEAIAFVGTGSFDSDGNIDLYEWDFGDGNSGAGESPTHIYVQNGTYTVTLNVTDNDGANDENSTTATVTDTEPIANFSAMPTTGIKPLTVNFTDVSTSYDGISAWEWDFGDGSSSSEQSPTYEYTAEGIYTVSLTVHEADGDCDTMTKVDCINVTRVNQPPVSDPNGPYAGTEGEAIVFDGTASYDSDGSIDLYEWDFGDGSSGAGESPTHIYLQNGTYTVTLNVTDNEGATDTNTTTATIADTLPTANFSGSPTTGLKPLTVNFTDNSTSYDGIVAWDWDFGDGDNSDVQNPTHAYANAGLYNVTLTVYEADGNSDTGAKVGYITVTDGNGENQPPVADANGAYTGVEGAPITYNGSGSYDPDGSIVAYKWSFGDGNTGTGVSPDHTYAQEGTYTVTLIVNDGVLDSAPDATTATVNDTEPTADFNAVPTSGSEPLTVEFTDISSSYDGIASWSWDFGDGETSNEQKPTHTYMSSGTYTVSLTIAEADDDTATKEDYIAVTPAGDTISPVIESVTLDAYTTIPDATIHVTVNATDNVGVTSVTADGVALVETGSTWEGDITVPSATGDYTLTIRAEDEAENVAETTVDYSVVTPTGGLGVAILPKISSAPAGSILPLDIKIVSTENFDDILHLYLTLDGIPPDYQADLSWFSWTDTTVQLLAGQEMVLSIEVDIPDGISGYKSFGVKAESTKWSSDAQDYGAVLVS